MADYQEDFERHFENVFGESYYFGNAAQLIGTRVKTDKNATYEIVELITPDNFEGEAHVFTAKFLDDAERPIRILKKYKVNDPRMREAKFRQELEILQTLNKKGYQGVVRLCDFSSSKNPFLILDYISGKSFEKILEIRGKGNLNLLETVSLALPTSQILSDMLSYDGIVHRDVKPENILLTDSLAGALIRGEEIRHLTSRENVRLCDFTLSLINYKSPVHDLMEEKNQGIIGMPFFTGTPYYCSPEIMYGDTAGCPESDVWALGIMMYEMISKQKAYPSFCCNAGAIVDYNNRFTEKAPKIQNPMEDLHGLDELIYGMRDYEPEKRPTINFVRDKLQEIYNEIKDHEQEPVKVGENDYRAPDIFSGRIPVF